MPNKKITLKSGKTLEIQLASFVKGLRLMKAVGKEIEGVKINLGMTGEIEKIKDLDINDEGLNTLKNIVLRLIASDEVESALWECMPVVLYGSKRVDKDLFEDPEARADYLVIVKEVLVYNLSPFFGNLGSLLSTINKKATESQESK